MTHQFSLFTPKETAPKVSLKKVITPERMAEVRKMMDNNKPRAAAEMLRDLNDDLEKIERRIR